MKFFNVALLFAGVALAAPNPAPNGELLVSYFTLLWLSARMQRPVQLLIGTLQESRSCSSSSSKFIQRTHT